MTGYDLIAIVNLLEDWNKKDYGFALYKEEYELLRTANLENTLVVVKARSKDRRILGKVKEILPLEEYGKNPQRMWLVLLIWLHKQNVKGKRNVLIESKNLIV